MDRFVLHHSVVARACAEEFQHESPARRFFHEQLVPGNVRCVVTDTFRFLVTRRYAALISFPDLDERLAQNSLRFLDFAYSTLDRAGVVRQVSADTPGLRTRAFSTAAAQRLDLEHAYDCALAELLGVPLLVGDANDFALVASVALNRSRLSVELVDNLDL